MDALQLTSVAVLLIAFVITAFWRINVGIILLAGAYGLTLLAGLPVSTIADSFPAEVFLLVAGVTFFFAVVDSSGTMHYIVSGLLRLMGGRVVAAPFVFFAISALATGIGTYPAAAAAMVLPIAIKFAYDYRIQPMLMGVMVVHGVLAGSFSPIATFGLVTDGVLKDLAIDSNPTALFLCHIAVHLLVCIAAFCLFGGLALMRRRPSDNDTGGTGAGRATPTREGTGGTATAVEATVSTRPSPFQLASMLSILVLVVCTVGFDLDIGYVAFTLGIVLTLVFDRKSSDAVSKMPWPVLALLVGVLCYVGVLTEVGTLDALGDLLLGMDSPALGVLALSLFGAITSAFASSLGILGANLQLAGPLISAGGFGTLDVVGPVSISTTIVDCSPLSIGGALILANAQPEDRPALLRKLLLWGGAMIIVGPLVSWTIFTLI